MIGGVLPKGSAPIIGRCEGGEMPFERQISREKNRDLKEPPRFLCQLGSDS
jgi:hypothetical protein